MADIHIKSIADLLSFAAGEDGYGTSAEYLNVYLDKDLDFALDNGGAYANTNFTGCIGNFYVNFYGQGHTIKNISYTGSSDWGFFQGSGSLNCFKVYDLTLQDIDVNTSGTVGGIIGVINVGGSGTSHLIQDCRVIGNIKSTNNAAGGLVGQQVSKSNLTIRNCVFSGNVSGVNNACGLIGFYRAATNDTNGSCFFYSCGVRGNIISTGKAGGIMVSDTVNDGYAQSGAIQKCYFIGTLSGTSAFGLTNHKRARAFSENYVVINASNVSVEMSNTANIYDNDVATTAEITVTGGTPETSAHLKDATYMRTTYNWSA